MDITKEKERRIWKRNCYITLLQKSISNAKELLGEGGLLASYQSTIRFLRPPFLSHYLPKIFIEPSGGGRDKIARCHFHFQGWEEVGGCRKASMACLLGFLEEPPRRKQLESLA